MSLVEATGLEQWPIQGGGAGGPGPPFGKVKNCKRAPLTENDVFRSGKRKSMRYYPPPSPNRVGFWRSRKISATTPPPLNGIVFFRSHRLFEITEKLCYYPPPPPPLNRVDMALHTKAGPLLRKILDLRLLKACLPWHTRILSQKNSESHASPPFRYVYCVKTQVKNAGHRHAICIETLQAPLDVFTGAPLCGATQ